LVIAMVSALLGSGGVKREDVIVSGCMPPMDSVLPSMGSAG